MFDRIRVGVVILPLILSSSLAAQNRPQNSAPTYTKREIDTKLDAIIADIKSLQGTYPKTELDAKLDAVRAELRPLQTLSLYSKGEVDAKLDALRAELRPLQTLGLYSKSEADAKFDGLEKSLKTQIDALGGKVAAIPFWLPVLVSVISALIAFAVFVRGWWTRAEDQKQRVEDINRVEDQLRKDGANSLIAQWTEREDLAAHVNWILTNPASLNDTNYGEECRLRLVKLGNWFNTLATRWRRNEADEPTLVAGDMGRFAKTFWQQFQRAKGVLATDANDQANLPGLEAQWQDLAWLVINK